MAAIIVPASGPVDSPFVIIGEAPGRQEIKARKPFVGPSGMVLQAALKQFKADSFPEPYVMNVVPHLIGTGKDTDLLQKLARENAKRVHDEIAMHPRKVILALGNAAVWALTNNYETKITKIRGQQFPTALAEHGIIATTHPAYLLRGNGSFRQFKADVAYAVSLACGKEPYRFVPPTWSYVDTPETLDAFLNAVREHKGIIAGDLETMGFSHRQDKILMGGFTLDGKHVYIIPGYKREYTPDRITIDKIAPMWESSLRTVNGGNVDFCWHNGKFDVKFLRHQHGYNAYVDEDTMLMSYALDETRGIHDLETVSSDWLGSPNWKGILDAHKKKNQSYDVIPEPILVKYMAYDIANTFNLHTTLRPLVAMDAKSELLYTKTLIPGSEYLSRIEMCGMYVDMQRVEENRAAYTDEVKKYNDEINAISIASGYGPINPNSPLQLVDFLFNTLKLPTKERSTNEKVLEKLPDHPAVVALRKYRKLNKGLTTYVTPITEHLQDDGRVHQSYLIHGTATGRLACRDPNLQNIPREPKLRGQFIPKPDYVYVECDLNQAELRSLAALSGDTELCRIYTDPNSKGLHEEVRSTIFGNPSDWSDEQLKRFYDRWYTTELERVLEEQKMRAKNTNFGIVYGITPAGLSEQIEDTVMEATRMLATWAKKFPQAWNFIQLCRNAPLHGKDLVTVFGHKKRFGVITPENIVSIQNEAANFPHQSTASTITMQAGIRLQELLKDQFNTDIVNTVHDCLLLEVPKHRETIDKVIDVTLHEMEQVPVDWGITTIPFKAEAKIGIRWGQLKSPMKFYSEYDL